ncbi:MAG: hypothetical protein E7Z93_04455 [Cyanobacteria bacterium SIG32]|nr:hypothetical protein [Cyanobacteria bacterium SIG32]
MIQTKEKLDKKDILKLFTSKPKSEHCVGLEYERLPISAKTFCAIEYSSVCEFLREFAKEENWDYITDDYNIIGLKQEHDTITLEPGSQIELSIKPEKTLFDLEKKLKILNQKMNPILDKMGITLLEYGVSPLSTHKNINLIPKRRYHIMAKYLWGILSDVMMRETAGIQGCFDFENEEDAVRKFKIANKLSPFITAMYANSPIRGGVETGYKSFRALSWLNTDNDRCGFACNLDDNFSFEKYIDKVIQSPVIFINKNNQIHDIKGKISFEEYMQNGFNELEADIDDFLLHANLYFPEVRLRNFIEIRNHDCNKNPLSLLAIYKGILYNEKSITEIEELFKLFTDKDFNELRYNVPKNGLMCNIKGYYTGDIAKEILKIAEQGLIDAKTNEEKFLEPIKELTFNNLCPADIIIKNWNGLWDKNLSKLISYLNN